MTQQPKQLLDQVRDAIRLKYYAYSTEKAYVAPTRTPTSTLTTAPTHSPSPTSTPTPTDIHTATATPTRQHPPAIDYMRRQTYPDSKITIEETLEPGANYDRYIASYLSEGFRIYALLTVPGGEKPECGWPVILFNHGYIPPAQYRTTERYVAYVDVLARSSDIVFRSDYRGIWEVRRRGSQRLCLSGLYHRRAKRCRGHQQLP